MEENFSKDGSDYNQCFWKRNLLQMPKKNFRTKITYVYHIDDIWSLDKLDLKDFRPENMRGY